MGVSSAEEVDSGMGACAILSRRLCSSCYTILWVFGTCIESAICIALLKEDQGPWPKEEEMGSETSSLCENPCGPKCATVCTTGARLEGVEAKWTAPNFFFLPFPAEPLFFFFPWPLPSWCGGCGPRKEGGPWNFFTVLSLCTVGR
jgi:hypothetical protein